LSAAASLSPFFVSFCLLQRVFYFSILCFRCFLFSKMSLSELTLQLIQFSSLVWPRERKTVLSSLTDESFPLFFHPLTVTGGTVLKKSLFTFRLLNPFVAPSPLRVFFFFFSSRWAFTKAFPFRDIRLKLPNFHLPSLPTSPSCHPLLQFSF